MLFGGCQTEIPKTISTIAELELAARLLCKVFDETVFWRGHADFGWPLRPSIFRPEHSEFKNQEIALINHFQGRALCQVGSSRNLQSDFEWICLARHFGLPTRLLDWTESPLVALYFILNPGGCNKYDDKDGCLWALSPSKLNLKYSNPGSPEEALNGLASVQLSVVKTMASIAFGVKGNTKLPQVLALQPWESNERIIAQTGRFTIHSTEAAVETLAHKETFLEQIIIKKECKSELRDALKALGVRRWSVFPDLENLAKGLVEEISGVA